MYVYGWTDVFVHACMYVRMCACMYVSMYVYILHTRTRTRTHTQTHTNTLTRTRRMQVNVSGLLQDKAAAFMGELWVLVLAAVDNFKMEGGKPVKGVPDQVANVKISFRLSVCISFSLCIHPSVSLSVYLSLHRCMHVSTHSSVQLRREQEAEAARINQS